MGGRLRMAYSKYRLVPVGLATSLLIGCGGMSAPGSVTPGPQPVEHTDVTFLLSSTANDQLVQANLTFTSFALTGVHMAMLLNLEVSPGQAHSICYSGTGSQPYTVTPALELTRVAAAVQPANSENGKESNLEGLITAIAANAGSFNVAAADRLAWSVA